MRFAVSGRLAASRRVDFPRRSREATAGEARWRRTLACGKAPAGGVAAAWHGLIRFLPPRGQPRRRGARKSSRLALGALICGLGTHSPAAELTAPAVVDPAIAAGSVRTENGHATGTILNRSSTPVHDVRLLIPQTYLWPNEFKPRGENPSRALVRPSRAPSRPVNRSHSKKRFPTRGLGRRFETWVTTLGYRYQEAREPESPPQAPAGDPTGSALPLPDLVAGC